MRERRLLERLNVLGVPGRRDALPADKQLLASVRDHVARLLNTRRGNVPIDQDYGIADLSKRTGAGGEADSSALEVGVAEVLRRYEPRLKDVGVRLVRHEPRLGLDLEITGVAQSESISVPIHLHAAVLADGQISFDYGEKRT